MDPNQDPWETEESELKKEKKEFGQPEEKIPKEADKYTPEDKGTRKQVNRDTTLIEERKTPTLVILSLIFSIVFSPAGLVLSIIALRKIKNQNLKGKKLALTALIIGIVFTAAGITLTILSFVLFEKYSLSFI